MTNDKIFLTREEWENKFFPELVKERELKKIEEDPVSLGIHSADESLKKVKLSLSNSN